MQLTLYPYLSQVMRMCDTHGLTPTGSTFRKSVDAHARALLAFGLTDSLPRLSTCATLPRKRGKYRPRRRNAPVSCPQEPTHPHLYEALRQTTIRPRRLIQLLQRHQKVLRKTQHTFGLYGQMIPGVCMK